MHQLIRQLAPIVDGDFEIEFLEAGAQVLSFAFGYPAGSLDALGLIAADRRGNPAANCPRVIEAVPVERTAAC